MNPLARSSVLRQVGMTLAAIAISASVSSQELTAPTRQELETFNDLFRSIQNQVPRSYNQFVSHGKYNWIVGFDLDGDGCNDLFYGYYFGNQRSNHPFIPPTRKPDMIVVDNRRGTIDLRLGTFVLYSQWDSSENMLYMGATSVFPGYSPLQSCSKYPDQNIRRHSLSDLGVDKQPTGND